MMQHGKQRIGALLTVLLLLLLLTVPRARAVGATQELTVRVGYAGLPFYEKGSYTIAELEQLGVYSALYTFLDAGGFACYAQAEGVRLTDILDAAGIDMSAVSRCHFLTTDSGGGYFTSQTASTLFRSQYAFPQLSEYYGEPAGELERRITDYDAVYAGAVPVSAMLSLRDNFYRVDDFSVYDPSLYPMTSAKQLRLFFGQSYPDEITARNMGYWVYEIDVELSGFPTLLATQEQLKLTVGSNQQAQVQVTAADELIRSSILQGLVWESDNPAAVTVDQNGMLTVIGEGEAAIRVSNEEYGLSAVIRVSSGQGAGNGGSGEGDGQGDGEGQGESPVDGNGEGSGGGAVDPQPTDPGNNQPTDPGNNQPTDTENPQPTEPEQIQPTPDATDTAQPETEPPLLVSEEEPATPEQPEKITMSVRRITLGGSAGSSANGSGGTAGATGTVGGSQALGLIKQDNPLALPAAILAAVLLLGGGLLRYLLYRKNRRGV